MKWLRKFFFRTVSGMDDPEPLAVSWQPGEVVFTIRHFPALTIWCWDGQLVGLSNPLTSTLRAQISSPMTSFFWPDAPVTAKIISVKIDGFEQLAQPEKPDEAHQAQNFGISGAMFQPRPYTYETPRIWWGWVLIPTHWIARRILGPLTPAAVAMLLAEKKWNKR